MANRQYNFYVYIMTSDSGVLYIGMTNNLMRRVEEHKFGLNEGFTKKYKCHTLVYYEYFTDAQTAIHRENEIKKWRREKKIALINSLNPKWDDLYRDWLS